MAIIKVSALFLAILLSAFMLLTADINPSLTINQSLARAAPFLVCPLLGSIFFSVLINSVYSANGSCYGRNSYLYILELTAVVGAMVAALEQPWVFSLAFDKIALLPKHHQSIIALYRVSLFVGAVLAATLALLMALIRVSLTALSDSDESLPVINLGALSYPILTLLIGVIIERVYSNLAKYFVGPF